jgi:hypothetical protein
MEAITAFHFLRGFTLIVLSFGLFYGPWQTMVIATTRQFIFELRDAWFDATVADERLRDNEAVRRVRATLNTSLELIDMFTWMTLLFFIFFGPKAQGGSLAHQARGLPHGDTQKLAVQLLHCSAMYILGHALARSIIFFPVGIGILARTRTRSKVICAVKHTWRPSQASFKRTVIREIERAALTMGDSRFRPTVRTRRAISV